MQVPSSIPGLSSGLSGLASLAAFIRDRLAEVAPAAGSLWGRREDAPLALTDGRGQSSGPLAVVIAAAGPFAPTSYARARLLRQMHASGLLSDAEAARAEQVFGVAQ